MKNNRHYKQILQALDHLEGMNGPDTDDYILIASELIKDLSQRIQNCLLIKISDEHDITKCRHCGDIDKTNCGVCNNCLDKYDYKV